ncbi:MULTISPECIES: hypothetical protein [unclassified Streptomyces]|uniref:hypothetical protein n=1 Tax=unclassified Streptomyces TaxID=2593676 RepID=UPI0024760ED7|nr:MULTISPECIES: hypothetical protein [unclassified Streptomyces]MDH6452409.1 phage shock protein PspC (stress-responsive transcriptional regulator) [Streptomyces sp. SAI-119]MDH6497035.1 phage shock protein PspC (stress-responsive transcriptional regulator) [Streptomyces sp. SAI-149]
MAAAKGNVRRLGLPEAAKQALFITAPLLTAAALGLAGVVGGAAKEFQWPGITLLLLVATSMILILSIQLGYDALQFRYTPAQVEEDIRVHGRVHHSAEELNAIVNNAFKVYKRRIRHAIFCFNLGTLMLGLGISAVLVPPPCTPQPGWRMAAAVLVLVCTVLDAIWIAYDLMQ